MHKLAKTLHPLERKVLPFLQKEKEFLKIVEETKLQEVEVMRALQWLENKKLLKIHKEEQELLALGTNGKHYIKKGLPERQLLEALDDKDQTLSELQKKTKLSTEELNASIGALRYKAAITAEKKKELTLKITEQGKELRKKKFLEEKLLEHLEKHSKELGELTDEEKYAYASLKKRKEILIIEKKKTISIELTTEGKDLAKEDFSKEVIGKLTPELIRNKTWKEKEFRAYDLQASVPKIYGGRTHFTTKALDYARQVWLDMGFKEMSGDMLQTSFWNFDALFSPQDHPAREMQDTFFVNTKGKLPSSKKLLKEVKEMHEGNKETKGWQYQLSEEETKKVVLRTHTTSLSSKTIANLKKEDLPVKYFAIGKCFRNEAIDWSHSFEFNQTEGIVIDPHANFRHLIAYLKQFFTKMGYPKARFRPAYFPYTEPSLEIDVYLEDKKQWIELGGAGIFRPEVVKPLLGFECPVLAWGPGLDRLIMLSYKLKDLRDLHKNDLKQIKEIEEWMK